MKEIAIVAKLIVAMFFTLSMTFNNFLSARMKKKIKKDSPVHIRLKREK